MSKRNAIDASDAVLRARARNAPERAQPHVRAVLRGLPYGDYVTGDKAVEELRLERALGETAWRLWLALLSLRETMRSSKETGKLHVGVPFLTKTLAARGTRSSERSVARALARLREAGLVVDSGWDIHRERAGAKYWRTVRGVRVSHSVFVIVPPETARWVKVGGRMAKNGWGGKRPGAGRKPSSETPPKESSSRESRVAAPNQEWLDPPSFSESRVAADLTLSTPLENTSDLRCAELGSAPEGAPTARGEGSRGKGERYDPLLDEVLVTEGELRVFRATGVLPPRAPSAPPPAPRSPAPRAEPPRRGYRSLEASGLVVTVPEAPRLDPSEKPERHAALLRDWYVACCERFFPKDKRTVWPLKNKPTQRTKHHALLVAAAKLFVEHGIRPAAWVHFTVSQWRHMGKAKAPPVGYVFAASRINGAGEDFNESGRCMRMTRYTPKGRLLIARELRAHTGVQPYVEGERDLIVEHVRAEVRDAQRRVLDDLACGRWIWDVRQ